MVVIWSTHKMDIKKLERLQRAATKLAPYLRNLTYKERLSKLKLPTLEKRKEKGDFIEVYSALKVWEKLIKMICLCVRTEQPEDTRRN